MFKIASEQDKLYWKISSDILLLISVYVGITEIRSGLLC